MAVMDYSLVQRIIDGTGQILDTTPGSPDSGSYVTEAQLRDWIKAGILFSGYYYNGNFYSDSGHTSPLAKVEGALYVDKTNSNKALYVCLSSTYQSLTEEAQVQAIIDGLNDGTIVPLKAKQDQNGNVIDTTYETKADANDLKNALQATNKRVTNLEQKAGDEIVVDYPSQTYGMDEVPANVAEYGKVSKLRGVSRVWNQLMPALASGNGYYSGNTYSSALSFSDGVCTVTVYNNGFDINYNLSLANGRTYLVFATLESSVSTTIVFRRYTNTANVFTQAINANQKTNIAFLFTPNSDSSAIQIIGLAATNETLKVSEWNLRDLTLYFNGNIPTNAQSLASIQQNYPELLIPSDYDAGSLVSTTYSGVRSTSINIWNEDWFNGYYATVTGERVPDASNLCSEDLIPVEPNTSYHIIKGLSNVAVVLCYGIGKNYLNSYFSNSALSGNNNDFTTPAGCYFIAFYTNDTTYHNDIQICKASESEKETYHPHILDTLSLPSPVELRSAGSVADEVELNVEVEGVAKKRTTERVGTIVYDGSDDEDWFSSVGGRFYIALHSLIKVQNYIGYILPSRLSLVGNNIDMTDVDNCITAFKDSATPAYPNQNWLYVRINSTITSVALLKAWLAQNPITVNYALATESVTLSDPILDPFIKVEGGGTIRPIQSQATEIDSSMTAEYLSLGANA